MYNLGDDRELDRMSREAAGKYRPPGDPNWQALQEELDKVLPAPEEKKRRFVFFWWLLPALLAGGAATYWLTRDTSEANKTVVAANKQLPAAPSLDKKENTTAAVVPGAAQKVTEKIKDNSVTGVNGEATALSVNEHRSTNKLVLSQPKETSKAITSAGKTNPGAIQAGSQSDLNITLSKTSEQPAKEKLTDPVTPKANKEEITKETPTNAATNITATLPVQETSPVTKENKTEPATADVVKDAGKEPQSKKPTVAKKGKGFSFELLAGVDKSTVKFKYGNEPGYNFGVLGGYHFNDKLSIHTGIIYTKKNYKVAGEDFTAPKGTPISYYKLETVDGYCQMWEVPLVARYTLHETDKHSFFLSAGLSSYFMTSENYDYFYYFNGVPTTKSNYYNSNDSHILSIAHLSAGFGNRISNNWSMQVEPYAKIPLGGVGFGNIKLSSFGINFSFQHRQPSKK